LAKIAKVTKILESRGLTILTTSIPTAKTKVKFICTCGTERDVGYKYITGSKFKVNCVRCDVKIKTNFSPGNRSITPKKDQALERAKRRAELLQQCKDVARERGYEILTSTIHDIHSKIDIRCKCGTTITRGYNTFMNHPTNCPRCIELEKISKVRDALKDKGFGELISTTIPSKTSMVEYRCFCGEIEIRRYGDLIRSNRACGCLRGISKITPSYIPTDNDTERWQRYKDRWVSSLGNVQDLSGKDLCMDDKLRYRVDGCQQYIWRLMAKAFQLSNWDKTTAYPNLWGVTHKDGDRSNNILSNLKITSKSERTSKSIKDAGLIMSDGGIEKYRKLSMNNGPPKVFAKMPSYEFFQNGDIWSTTHNNFIKLSIAECGYYRISKWDVGAIGVHRIICYLFNPKEPTEFNKYDSYNSYKHLQVNHKDGDPTNNAAHNLEWCTQSHNIQHAYDTGRMSKKTMPVRQYDKETGAFIKEFVSLAKASRESGDTVYAIKSSASNKVMTKTPPKYRWMYADLEKVKLFSHRYTQGKHQ
jgi:hypothetical protein